MDALFEGRSVPRWLRAFERDPDEALDALLFGRADCAHLNAAEPSELLLDWLRALGDDFGTACDVALERWIERAWGQPLPATGSATQAALAWVGACDLIAGSSSLSRAAAALRARFLDERHVLAGLVEGRARDPEGRAWLALARHQPDRALLPEWWRLCSLPPDEPWYRGLYGVQGLEYLPPEQPGRGGGFPVHVAEGLRVLALALLRREHEGWLRPHDGEREFVPVARLTMAAFPFPERWRAFWREALEREPERAEVLREWARKAGARVTSEGARASGGARRALAPDPGWARQAKDIAARLPEEGALAEAQRLIEAEERYTQATGDTYSLVRSLCSFAAPLRRTRPERALAWATRARQLDPWDAYTWTTSATCALALDRLPEALDLALEATRRFPGDAVARTGLAEVLKANGDFDQAEAVYRETLARFPGDAVARTGLAEILKAKGDLDQAEAVYRETVTRFPDNAIARTGLAEILKAKGDLDQAEAVYRETLARFPDDRKYVAVARNGLAEVLKAKGDLDEAEAVYRETVTRFPDNAVARNGLAEILKAQGDLDQAEAVYRETVARFPNDRKNVAVARTGLAQLLRERGRLAEARTLYQAVLDGAPDAQARQIARQGLETLGLRTTDGSERTDGASLAAPRRADGWPAVLHDGARAPQAPDPNSEGETSEPLRATDVPHLLADAYLLRRFGLALGPDAAPARSTGRLRLRARGVLVALQPRLERDARAAGASALTELTLGDLQEAQALLQQAVRRFPGSARVRYADARLARALTQRDASQGHHAQQAWQRLERLDPRFRPAAWLGAGRTWLALPGADERARQAFGQLARWLTQPRPAASDARRDASAFSDWWAAEVRARVFGVLDARSADDLPDLDPLRRNLERDSSSIDDLEHDLVERFAFV